MAKEYMLRCDACDKTEPMAELEGLWLNVASAAGPRVYAELSERAGQGEKVDDLVDSGDFCSLMCLANWASARASLRELG